MRPNPEPNSNLSPDPEPNSNLSPDPEPNSNLSPDPEPNSNLSPNPEPNSNLSPDPGPVCDASTASLGTLQRDAPPHALLIEGVPKQQVAIRELLAVPLDPHLAHLVRGRG